MLLGISSRVPFLLKMTVSLVWIACSAGIIFVKGAGAESTYTKDTYARDTYARSISTRDTFAAQGVFARYVLISAKNTSNVGSAYIRGIYARSAYIERTGIEIA